MQISPNGSFVRFELTDSEYQFIRFQAHAGVTYTLDTELRPEIDGNRSLTDTVMELYPPNPSSANEMISENDDDGSSGRMDSLIDWTCPTDGEYYVRVTPYGYAADLSHAERGTFYFRISRDSVDQDPCTGVDGAALVHDGETISFPVESHGRNLICTWRISCATSGDIVTLNFDTFEMEQVKSPTLSGPNLSSAFQRLWIDDRNDLASLWIDGSAVPPNRSQCCHRRTTTSWLSTTAPPRQRPSLGT